MDNDEKFLAQFEISVLTAEESAKAGNHGGVILSPEGARHLLTIIKDQAAALTEWQQFQPKAEDLPVWEGIIGGTE